MREKTTVPVLGHSLYAVLIGTDQYPRLPSADLKGCVNDATAIRDFLIDHVGVPAANIQLLTSPEARTAALSTAANIRAAFRALTADHVVKPGDHVVLSYSCHGVRLAREHEDGRRQVFYGFAAADFSESASGYASLILDREINHFLQQLKQRGVSTTIIADSCHAGASTRSSDRERYIKDLPPLRESEWQALLQHHPALSSSWSGTRGMDGGVERLAAEVATDADCVFLAACQDHETAKESEEQIVAPDGTLKVLSHGLLTVSLLQALRQVPAEKVGSLRWLDFFDDLRRLVVQRAAARSASSQKPALEGSRERPVFGGKWRAFAPGFAAHRTGRLCIVDGGALHGLEVGAELALYPADSADFETDADLGLRAIVTEATASTSTARLVGAEGTAPAKSRARLITLGPDAKPLLVRLAGIPEPILRAAALDGPDARAFLSVVGADQPAHLAILPWRHSIPASVWGAEEKVRYFTDARDGWILVRSDAAGMPALLSPRSALAPFEPAPEDIIAYLPGEGSQLKIFADQEARLGHALRDGLLHYAKYLRTRDRSRGDHTLRALLSVQLRVGNAADAPMDDQADRLPEELIAKTASLAPRDGIHHITQGQWLFVEVTVEKPTSLRLFVGLLCCSDDGNIYAVWPPEGENHTFAPGSTTYLGMDRFNPLFLNHRPDQRVSDWTLKLIAYTAPADSDPINLRGLAQNETVQDRFAASLTPTKGVLGRPSPPRERAAWCTWDLRIACHKPAAHFRDASVR